jgi:hypothetical protein
MSHPSSPHETHRLPLLRSLDPVAVVADALGVRRPAAIDRAGGRGRGARRRRGLLAKPKSDTVKLRQLIHQIRTRGLKYGQHPRAYRKKTKCDTLAERSNSTRPNVFVRPRWPLRVFAAELLSRWTNVCPLLSATNAGAVGLSAKRKSRQPVASKYPLSSASLFPNADVRQRKRIRLIHPILQVSP